MSRTLPLHRPAGAHPIRQSLRFAELKRKTRRQQRLSMPRYSMPIFSMQDLREFLMAYCACFLAVSLFIA